MLKSSLALAVFLVCGWLALPAAAFAQFGGFPGLGHLGGGPGSQGAPSSSLANMLNGSNSFTTLEGLASHLPEGKNDSGALEEAKNRLGDPDPRLRLEGLEKLRFTRGPKANDLLIGSLIDPDIRVRIKAVDLLGAREVEDAVAVLSQRLSLRGTPDVERQHLVAALGRIGKTRGTLSVVQYLEEEKDNRSRGLAIFALGEMGDPRASDILIRTLNSDTDPTIRRLAEVALEKIGGELPSRRSAELADQRAKKQLVKDEKLAKLRALDQKIQEQNR